MALIKCDECGKMISDKAQECPHCGCPVTKKISTFICPECGKNVNEDINNCPNCGYQFANETDSSDTLVDSQLKSKDVSIKNFILFIPLGLIAAYLIYCFTQTSIFETKMVIGEYDCGLNSIYKTACIYGYRGKSKWEIRVPEKVKFGDDTYKVTEIGEKAFAELGSDMYICIPETVDKISEDCFRNTYGVIRLPEKFKGFDSKSYYNKIPAYKFNYY